MKDEDEGPLTGPHPRLNIAQTESLPAPDKSGLGRSWRCNIDALRALAGRPPESDGTVAMWVIEAPWAHPFWHSYLLTLVHLRPLTPPVETKFFFEGATHELWLDALNPDEPRLPPITGTGYAHRLLPKNFAAQMLNVSDEAAIMRMEAAIDLILAGDLSPDTDFRHQWIALFGDNMTRD